MLLFSNTPLTFYHNPFQGLTSNEIVKAIVPRKEIAAVAQLKAAIQVIEVVTDRRGTSESVYRENLHDVSLKHIHPIDYDMSISSSFV